MRARRGSIGWEYSGRHILSVPGDDIERCMVLLACEILSAEFVYNLFHRVSILKYIAARKVSLTIPRSLVNFKVCDGMLEVTDVGETVCTERSKLGKLVVGAEDFLDI